MSKLFGWTADDGGLARIRVKLPFDELARHGHEVNYDMRFAREWGDADTVVGVRIAMEDPSRLWARICGMFGGPFAVFETDDDLMAISPYNKLGPWQFWSRPDVRWRYTANLRIAHRVVTSTEYLAQALYDQFGHPDIVVAPNTIPGWMLELPPVPPPGFVGAPGNDPERVVVGWAGGSSHAGDWERIRQPVGRALRALPGAEFHCVGVDYSKGLRLPAARVKFIDWFDSTDDFWREGLHFHVALAPLASSAFNLGKSDIKIKEAFARGVPVIASDYGPYRAIVEHGVTGLLCRTPDHWREAIHTMVTDHALRERMAKAARAMAQEFTIETLWPRYEEAYTP